jgi:hypothetical protein
MTLDGLRGHDECIQMISALVDRMVRVRDDHAKGALAALTWLTGASHRRPICGDEVPAEPTRIAFEAGIASSVARERGVDRASVIFAEGVLDAMLWAYGNDPIVPLV